MQQLSVEIAKTKSQLDACFKIRYEVFGNDLAWASYDLETYPAERESDSFDCLNTTHNLIGGIDGEAAGTVRLLLPNSEVAKKNSWKYGLPIEKKYSLNDLQIDINQLGEIPRSSVIKKFRGNSRVALALWSKAYSIAIENHLTHLIAITNTENDLDGSNVLYENLKANNHVDKTFAIVSKFQNSIKNNTIGLNSTNTPILMPSALKIYIKAGCKVISHPIYDEFYKRYIFIIIWPIKAIESKQKKLIERMLKID